jgi:GAF domain-containing protein
MIKGFFSAPVFANEDDNFRAKFINGFAWATILLLTIALLPYLSRETTDLTVFVLSGLILVMAGALFLLRRGRVTASGSLIAILGWLGLGFQAYSADGVKDVILIGYISLGLLTSIIISLRAGGVVILSSVGVIWVLGILEQRGLINPRFQDPIGYSRDLSFIFVSIAVLIYFSTTSLREAIRRASKSEANLRASNLSLQELNQTLESRVASRTANLELANQRNEKRASQFETIAQVARATASNQNLDSLLPNLADLISRQFGFYHVGIFLIDENRDYAELRAANSEGGRRMLARGHKLGVGQSGIVGYVSATGKPRIALDVGDDAAYFNNPDLPGTRSEMALPLRAADQVIGVLDVQSIASNAFQEEDVEVLSTLADQVSVAIQNSRSYETSQELLREAQQTAGAFLHESWRILQGQVDEIVGYRAVENKVTPLDKPLASTKIQQALLSKQTVKENGEEATLAIPIRLRDEVIGVMDIRVPDVHEWDADEVDVAEAVADRLSLALEASLLLRSTQRRAEIERITAEISNKLGATSQIDAILRTAAEELSVALGGSEVLVQIQPDALEMDLEADQKPAKEEAISSRKSASPALEKLNE